jgi:uncharacterized DUF497 family protein
MRPARYGWDEAKRLDNIERHGLDFLAALRFDRSRAVDFPDDRYDYGEERRLAYGYVDGRLHALVYTPRGDACPIISFSKANRREQAPYAAGYPPRRR